MLAKLGTIAFAVVSKKKKKKTRCLIKERLEGEKLEYRKIEERETQMTRELQASRKG